MVGKKGEDASPRSFYRWSLSLPISQAVGKLQHTLIHSGLSWGDGLPVCFPSTSKEDKQRRRRSAGGGARSSLFLFRPTPEHTPHRQPTLSIMHGCGVAPLRSLRPYDERVFIICFVKAFRSPRGAGREVKMTTRRRRTTSNGPGRRVCSRRRGQVVVGGREGRLCATPRPGCLPSRPFAASKSCSPPLAPLPLLLLPPHSLPDRLGLIGRTCIFLPFPALPLYAVVPSSVIPSSFPFHQ